MTNEQPARSIEDRLNDRMRDLGTALSTHPLAPLPITHTNDSRILPRKYLVHRHSQYCKGCGTLHEWSQVYAYNQMMTRNGVGKLVIHLVPVEEIRYNLPIECLPVTRKIVPLCHECFDTKDLSHLIDPRSTDEWRRIYAIGPAPEAPKRTSGKSTGPKPKPTIDDLL